MGARVEADGVYGSYATYLLIVGGPALCCPVG